MKKFLVVLLALAMVFGLGSVAFAADTQIADYADLAGVPAEQQAAIYRLTALGVLAGDGIGGDFRPEDTITRAEFAKIAIFLAGKEDAVALYASFAPAFADVQDGTWYEGYVNAAVAFGYMKGYADNTFKPGQTVTMQEVATVLLRIAGYTDALKGEWPNDYIRKANDIEILAYVDFVGPKAATRAEVASIANELLDKYMVVEVENEVAAGLGMILGGRQDVTFVDEDGFTYLEGKTNEDAPYLKVLTYAFGATTATEQFAMGMFVETSGWYFEDYKKGELVFDFVAEDIDVAADYYVFGADFFAYANHKAEVTLNEDGDVLFVEITSTRETVNDIDVSDYEEATGFDFTMIDGDYGYLWLNDDAEVYAELKMDTYAVLPYFIVKEVEIDDEDVDVDLEGNDDFSYDSEDEIILFIKDGEFISVEDLEDDDVLFFLGAVADEEDCFVGVDVEEGIYPVWLVVSPVEGEMNKLYSQTIGEIKIDDVVYNYKNIALYSDNDGKTYGEATYPAMYGDELEDILYVPHYAWANVATIIADIEDKTDDVYAVVIGYEAKGKITGVDNVNDELYIKDKIEGITVLTEAGEEVTYAFKKISDITTLPELGDAVLLTINEKDQITALTIEALLDASAKDELDVIKNQALKIKANGKVTVTTTLTGTDVYTITEDTVIAAVYTDEDTTGYGWDDFEKAEIIAVEDVLGTTMVFDYAFATVKAGTTKVEYIYVVDPELAAKAGDVVLAIATEHYQSKKVEYVELLDGTTLVVQDETDAINSFANLEHGDLANLVAFYCLADEELTTYDATKATEEKVEKGEFVWLWDANYINANVDASALFTKYFDDDNAYTVVINKATYYSSDLDEIIIGGVTLYVDGVKAIDLTDDCDEVSMKRAYKDQETLIVVYGADNTVVAAYITDAAIPQI